MSLPLKIAPPLPITEEGWLSLAKNKGLGDYRPEVLARTLAEAYPGVTEDVKIGVVDHLVRIAVASAKAWFRKGKLETHHDNYADRDDIAQLLALRLVKALERSSSGDAIALRVTFYSRLFMMAKGARGTHNRIFHRLMARVEETPSPTGEVVRQKVWVQPIEVPVPGDKAMPGALRVDHRSTELRALMLVRLEKTPDEQPREAAIALMEHGTYVGTAKKLRISDERLTRVFARIRGRPAEDPNVRKGTNIFRAKRVATAVHQSVGDRSERKGEGEVRRAGRDAPEEMSR